MMSIDICPWPGWNIVREIGRGSFGRVYEIHRKNDVFLSGTFCVWPWTFLRHWFSVMEAESFMNLHPHAMLNRVLWRWYQSPFGL